jgi:hypothetical protein
MLTRLGALVRWHQSLAEPPVEEPVEAPRAFRCGVPDCEVAQEIVEQDTKWTVVECSEHGCRTRWETEEREEKEQTVIRVQDNWRQHGTSPPPGKTK